MNQVHGIIKRFRIAFHSTVYIQVSIQFRCLVRTCHTVELADKSAALRSRNEAGGLNRIYK